METPVIVLVITALLGLVQLYQRNVTKSGDLQEDKNEEILEVTKGLYLAQAERDQCRDVARKYKEQFTTVHKEYKKLVTAVNENCTPELKRQIRKSMKK